jgi:anti-anti-sigma regulatory factor
VTTRVVGDVDMDTAGVLATQLDRDADGFAGDVTVDLASVTFLDSTGLCALLRARTGLIALHRSLVAGPSRAAAARIFELAVLQHTFRLAPEPFCTSGTRRGGSTEHLGPHVFARPRRNPSPPVGDGGDKTQAPPIAGVVVTDAWQRLIVVVDFDAQAALVERGDDCGRRTRVHDGVRRQLGHDELRVASDSVRTGNRGEPFPECVTSKPWGRRRPSGMESHRNESATWGTVVTYPGRCPRESSRATPSSPYHDTTYPTAFSAA